MPTPPLPVARDHRSPVVVFGASGFIGRFVVDELCRQQWRVRACVRRAPEPPFDDPSVEIVQGDIRDAAAVMKALAGTEAVVNVAGLKSDESESEAVNVGGARNLVAAARAHGDLRIIHISTQAVKLARPGLYARTKRAADDVVERSGLPFTILRPSVAYGAGRSGVFSTMQQFIERLPVVPVLGDGRWTSAPVHAADVARAIAACLATPDTIGRSYDLGGPDLVTLDELLDRIAAHCGRGCRKLHLPLGFSLLLARALSWLPRPPVSVSNVLGSNQEIQIDSAPARREFGFASMPLDAGLRLMKEKTESAALADEALLLARNLLAVEPSRELVNRYATAARRLFPDGSDRDVAFVRRHRWTLSCLDAATALFRPRSQLRQRSLLMLALLETAPEHAEYFLAPPPDRWALGLGLVRRGLSSAAKFLGGSLLLPFISWRRTSM